jgi:hypothetical protein
MPRFQKGDKRPPGAGRKKGQLAAGSREIAVWCREMFEDPRYQLSVRTRLLKGRLPPQVECKLLAYAYGEPARDITLNANLRGLVSVVHEHIQAQAQPVLDVTPQLPAGDCMNMHETVVERTIMHPVEYAAEDENAEGAGE